MITCYSLIPFNSQIYSKKRKVPTGYILLEQTQFLLINIFVLPLGSFYFQTTCSEHCLQKYLKMTQRISMRFQEYHIQQNEALAAKAGLLGQPRQRSPNAWTFDERLPTPVALEMRIHLTESHESSSHHVKQSVMTVWQTEITGKTKLLFTRIIIKMGLIVQ